MPFNQIAQTPTEVIIGVVIASLVRLKATMAHGWIFSITSTVISLGAGVGLYEPILNIFNLSPDWAVFVAVLNALIAENLMKAIYETSNKKDALARALTFFITRDPSVLTKEDETSTK